MPRHAYCCVPGCKSRSESSPEVSFHSFPKNDPLRSEWILMIKRDEGENFKVTEHTVVCSKHFNESDFYPTSSLLVASGDDGLPAKRPYRRVMPRVVPSVFSFRPAAIPRPSPDVRRSAAAVRQEAYEEEKIQRLQPAELELAEKDAKIKELEKAVACLTLQCSKLKQQLFRFENMKDNPKQLEFLTGMSPGTWKALWQYLKATPESVRSVRAAQADEAGSLIAHGSGRRPSLSLEDQLLLVLVRLRLGRLEQELAYEFGISTSAVSRIIITWINFLYLRLGLIPIWPSWEATQRAMPAVFQTSFPKTFAIVDATELRCQVPSSLSVQSQHYSSYKSHTTMKGLVAISPNGSFIFLSQLFSGSISDRQLFLESGLMSLVKSIPAGCGIMADRGFEVQDLLVPHDVLLNIPPFKGSQVSMPKGDVLKTQTIANARIHVERAIGRVKNRFHILDGVIPLSIGGSVNQIWTVCCLLTNFSGTALISGPKGRV